MHFSHNVYIFQSIHNFTTWISKYNGKMCSKRLSLWKTEWFVYIVKLNTSDACIYCRYNFYLFRYHPFHNVTLKKSHKCFIYVFDFRWLWISLHCVGSSMYDFLTPLRTSFNCANNNSLFTRKNIVCYSTQLYFSMYKSMREQFIFVFCIYNNNAIISSLWLQNYRGKYN